MKDYLRRKFVEWATKRLFKVVTIDDILFVNERGEIWFKRKQLDAQEINALKGDVEQLKKSFLWELIENEIGFDACERQFKQGISPNDLIFGRAELRTLEIIKGVLDKIEKL